MASNVAFCGTDLGVDQSSFVESPPNDRWSQSAENKFRAINARNVVESFS
jgi:hypothetical protein